ncbi:MAG: RNA polymerase sigma factor, partial [Deltaproteobacteria bacterium]
GLTRDGHNASTVVLGAGPGLEDETSLPGPFFRIESAGRSSAKGRALADGEDHELIEAVLRGEAGPTEVFCGLLIPTIRAIARARWPSLRHRVDELESRALVLLASWLCDKSFGPEQSLREIAAKLVNRVASDERDALETLERKREALMAQTPDEGPASVEDEVVARELRAKVAEVMAELKPRHQQVLAANDAADRGGPDVATALGIEPAAARQLLSRARLELLERLTSAGIELGGSGRMKKDA